jgi:hypothetical protein
MPMELAHWRQASSLESNFWSMSACRCASVPAPCCLARASSSASKSKLGSGLHQLREFTICGLGGTAGAVFLEELGDLDLVELLHGKGRALRSSWTSRSSSGREYTRR